MAALLGAVPLAIGFGDGAQFRQPLHIPLWRIMLSQLLTLYTTPVVYTYGERFSLWLNRRRGHPVLAPVPG